MIWNNSHLTGALAAQYSALEPLPGTFVDGKFTLGENIGDLGGINAAYDGLQLYLKKTVIQVNWWLYARATLLYVLGYHLEV
jgi:predicted metalloendopeptidase